MYTLYSKADVDHDFGYVDVIPVGIERDGTFLSDLVGRKPCFEELRFDHSKTNAEGLYLDAALLSIDKS